MRGALELAHRWRAQLAMYDYLLPGDFMPEAPTQRDWLGRRRPMPITNELEVWAGTIARERVLMDLQALIDAMEKELE